MAEPTEPKKETVRIGVTAPSYAKTTDAHDTVRITLPSRPPASAPLRATGASGPGSAPPPAAEPLIPPAPEKPVQSLRFVPPPVSVAPKPPTGAAPLPIPPTSPGPKKETARVAVLPDPPPASASVQMKKTQPLINMPAMAVPAPLKPATVRPELETKVDSIPLAFCWGLVGVSAVVLLIQILNYIS